MHPAFSPDGRWLAYGTDDSGAMEVFVQAFPPPGPRVQVSAGGGNAPIWARDGRTLSYVKPGAEAMLMEVTLETAPTLRRVPCARLPAFRQRERPRAIPRCRG